MDKENLSAQRDQVGGDHEHHHDHGGCGCGHEHHHDHCSCGCGHEHHHDHGGCSCGHDHNHEQDPAEVRRELLTLGVGAALLIAGLLTGCLIGMLAYRVKPVIDKVGRH